MFEEILYGWLAFRLGLSIALGVRTANRLRRDETSRTAFAWVVRLHVICAGVTWILEAMVRAANIPAGGLVAVGVFPMLLMYTVWVPFVDGLGFAAVTAIVAVVLVRRRLVRYRDEMLLGEPEQRLRAAQACEFLGWLARQAVPELVQATSDPEAELRYRAVRALGAIRPDETDTVDALRRCLTDRDGRVRIAAGCALARLKAADNAIVLPGVLAALQSEDDDLRELGVRAASVMKQDAAPAAELLAAMTEHWKLAAAAFEALRAIGPAAQPALNKLLTHPKKTVRQSASIALSQIPPEDAIDEPYSLRRLRGIRPALPRAGD
jgi:hypothetical protein